MSIITLTVLFLVILLFLRCSNGKCKQDNIVSIVIGLLKKILIYFLEIFTYAVKKAYTTDWFGEGGHAVPLN